MEDTGGGDTFMSYNLPSTSLAFLALLIMSGTMWAQAKQQTETLVINGQTGQAAVVHVDGRTYVDLETLAHIANGSLSFNANRIVLNLPPSTASTSVAIAPPTQVDDSGLSRDFMRAGMEAIALMREWASPLAYSIQNGYPVTENWVLGYREQAAHGLRLASAAAATDADRGALQLLTNEFEAVREWSNKLVEARKSMNTGQYSVSANALRDDPLSQKIVACGRFLAPMLASGSIQDDPSCH
jgi:hypothetical protein